MKVKSAMLNKQTNNFAKHGKKREIGKIRLNFLFLRFTTNSCMPSSVISSLSMKTERNCSKCFINFP